MSDDLFCLQNGLLKKGRFGTVHLGYMQLDKLVTIELLQIPGIQDCSRYQSIYSSNA